MQLIRGRRFADVSVDEIAAAARIGRRTFFRYFPTKEDVFLDRRRIDREFVTAALQARLPGEDDVALVMRVLVEVQRWAFAPFKPEHQAELHRLTHFEPGLAAPSWLLMEEVRELLVGGAPRARSQPFPCASCARAGERLHHGGRCGITSWIEGGLRDNLGSILAYSAEHLRRGFADEVTALHTRGV